MRPRTKLHLRVMSLSAALPKLSAEQEQWAYQNCLLHVAYRTKTKTACLDCGHTWATGNNRLLIAILVETECNCPNCGVKLSIKDTRTKLFSQRTFLGWIDMSGEFQVNRFFEIRSNHKAGGPASIYIREVVQQWLQPGGKNEVVAKNRGMGYCDHFHGDLEIRDRNYLSYAFNINPTGILPQPKCLPIYKRNGFKGRFGNVTPYDLFTSIISDSKAETLLKANQWGLFSALHNSRRYDIAGHWNSVKICIRNKYIVKNGVIWLDYLDLLVYFKKDMRSAYYVCPKNLRKAHGELVAKKTEIDLHERYTSKLKELGVDIGPFKNQKADRLKAEYDQLIAEKNEQKKQLDQTEYEKAKKIFFGLMFSSENITIKVLENIQEFIEEAAAHKHCVFTNGYYKKADSLILSAKVDGKPVETIEVSLSKMKIIQSRGLQNQATKYNQQIIALLQKNLGTIRKLYKGSKNQTKAA